MLIFISQSQGELDWVAPLFTEFIKNKIRVHIYFDSYSTSLILKKSKVFNDLRDKNDLVVHTKLDFTKLKYILNYFKKYSFNNQLVKKFINKFLRFYFTCFSKFFSKKIYDNIKPHILLKDLGADNEFRFELSKYIRNKGGKIIMYPHGTEIFVEAEAVKKKYMADLLLVSNKETQKYYSKVFEGIKTKIIGVPRYDLKWIKFLTENYGHKKISQKKNQILFITRGPHPIDLNIEDFNYLLNSVFSICEGKNIKLLIRSHPRYSKSQLRNVLKNYKNLDWSFCDDEIIVMKENLNLIISMWSTMILDALVLNIPVIQFFKCNNKRKWFVDSEGKNITGYEKNKIVVTAENHNKLKKEINKLINKDLNEVKNTFNNFNKLYDINYPSIQKSINAITEII